MTSAWDRRLQSQTGLPAGDFGPNLITPPGRDRHSALGLSRSGLRGARRGWVEEEEEEGVLA